VKTLIIGPVSRLFWAGIDLPLEHSNWLLQGCHRH
jgi:hypothetical protein